MRVGGAAGPLRAWVLEGWRRAGPKTTQPAATRARRARESSAATSRRAPKRAKSPSTTPRRPRRARATARVSSRVPGGRRRRQACGSRRWLTCVQGPLEPRAHAEDASGAKGAWAVVLGCLPAFMRPGGSEVGRGGRRLQSSFSSVLWITWPFMFWAVFIIIINLMGWRALRDISAPIALSNVRRDSRDAAPAFERRPTAPQQHLAPPRCPCLPPRALRRSCSS